MCQVADVPVRPATPGADASAATGVNVSEDCFDALRPRMLLGRAFSAAEHPAEGDGWVPVAFSRRAPRNTAVFTAVGRLAPGRTLTQADRELGAVMARVRAREPNALYVRGVELEPLREYLVGDSAPSVRLVAGAGLLMLLIARADSAAANLVRGSARARELAVRVALGAGRGRVVRRLVTEQLVIAAVSGGIALALVGVEVAVALVLLAGAALLVDGFRALVARDLGFATPPRRDGEGHVPVAALPGERAAASTPATPATRAARVEPTEALLAE
jgi:hypothetical protein